MNVRPTVGCGLTLAKTGLAALLVVLLLALSVGAAMHRDHQNHQASQHFCVVCLLAHGGVAADGATGIPVISASPTFVSMGGGESISPSSCDLRLAPGRGPPV